MYSIDIKNPISIHFIGIGGISMSGLAEFLHNKGFTVSGSDAAHSALTEHLESLGISIFIGQKASNISSNMNLVVYSAAIHTDNPEYVAALSAGIECLSRAELLGQIMENYSNSIAISGTHGKTTTTSMMSDILLQAQADPTISVGAILDSIGGNMRVGNSDYFVTEACEYTNSFLQFFPKVGVILNVEADHLDFFKDLDDIRRSFHHFASNISDNGSLILNKSIPNPEELTKGLSCKILTFGLTKDCDYQASSISYDKNANATFSLIEKGRCIGTLTLKIPGEHNILNALAAIAAAREFDVSYADIFAALSGFHSAERRFEFKGKLGNITIIDDYAHHPSEIKAALTAARNYPHDKLWCIFQPHTYSRTKAFLAEFAEALSLADKVVLADIYRSRETDTLGISSKDLLAKLKERNVDCHYFPSFHEIEAFLLEHCMNNDMLITMGAGDIVLVGEHLLGK